MSAAYTTQALIENQIPAPDLIAALDETQSGTLNTVVLNNIIGMASDEVDGYIAATYVVPFVGSIPPACQTAATWITCEMIYKRRKPDAANPFSATADMWRKRLNDVGENGKSLDANFARSASVPPVVASLSCVSIDCTTA